MIVLTVLHPLPQPIPPHFHFYEHCAFHQSQGHDTEHCISLCNAIQDLSDAKTINLSRLSVTTNPLPTLFTHSTLVLLVFSRSMWMLAVLMII